MSESPRLSWNDQVISEFRSGKERIADMFDRENLLLLGTTGAKSGQSRVHPVAFFTEGGRTYVVASAAGNDEHPAWYFNLAANPRVHVEVYDGDTLDSYDATATTVEASERDRLYADVVVPKSPGFADYEKKTTRVIPVVALDRV